MVRQVDNLRYLRILADLSEDWLMCLLKLHEAVNTISQIEVNQ